MPRIVEKLLKFINSNCTFYGNFVCLRSCIISVTCMDKKLAQSRIPILQFTVQLVKNFICANDFDKLCVTIGSQVVTLCTSIYRNGIDT